MNDGLLVAGLAVVGVAVVGPLLNHAVVRWIGWRVVLPPCFGQVPERGAVGEARARCVGCARPLAPAGLPALPAAVVGGRCRACGSRLAPRHLAVELTTGVLFGLVAAVVGWSVALVPLLALGAGVVAMSAVDLAVMRIPTRFVYATAAVVAVGLVLASVVDGPARRLVGAGVGAAAFGGFLGVLHLISPRSLGFGDVRLATLVGAVVGWCAWRAAHPVLAPVQAVLYAGLLAGLVGSVAGGALLIVRRRDQPFPFGPALAAGGMAVALAAF
jgi:leader peptidase (prepilin peptidase) / N-methyltransferase